MRHDPRHRAHEGSRDAHALAVAGAARAAHLPACAGARRADPAARHDGLLHAAVCDHSPKRSTCWRASPPKASSSHAPDAHLRRPESSSPARASCLPEQAGEHLTRVLRLEPGAPSRCSTARAANIGAHARARRQEVWARSARMIPVERESPLHDHAAAGRRTRRAHGPHRAEGHRARRGAHRARARRTIGGEARREAARTQARALAGHRRSRPASNAAATACPK